MNYNQILIENITIDDNHNISYKNSKNVVKNLIIKTPKLYLPFGVDKTDKDYFLNVQLRKSRDKEFNNELDKFELFIQNIENLIKTKLNKEINSQLRYSEKYDTMICLKIKKYKDKITTQVKQNNSFFNFYKITKGIYLDSEIIIDKVWIYNDVIHYKIKAQLINISV